LIERTALRRVWRVSGPFETRVEWSLDHRGWKRYLGLERVYVEGVPAWTELAFTHGLTGWADFVIHAADGPVPFRIERHIFAGRVVALRLMMEGTVLYWEGDLSHLPPGPPGLPIPADSRVGTASGLPLPGVPPEAPISTRRRTRLTFHQATGLAGLLILALVLGTIFKGYLDFRRAYGDPELVRAAARGDATRVRQLLQHGSPANSYHLEGSSALWWAVSSGSLECVQLLLDHGADPNGRGQWDSVIEQAVQDLEFNDGKPRAAIIQALLAQRSRIRDPAQLKLLEDAATRER
jgi:hypothetical protein